MQRKDVFVEGEFYHLYNRGNSKQPIFLDDQDRDRFVKLLYLCNSERSIDFREDIVRQKIDAFEWDRGDTIVSIAAWVLMPNHFHILVSEKESVRKPGFRTNGISSYMHKLLTSYSKYFNKKYGRVGGLFEAPFQGIRLDTDRYLKYMYSYIHLNPIKLIDKNWKDGGTRYTKKFNKFLDNYVWSSYGDYMGIRRSYGNVLDTTAFPEYFKNPKIFKEEIFDWLTFGE